MQFRWRGWIFTSSRIFKGNYSTDTDALCISLVIDYMMNQRNHSKFPTIATWQILLTKPKLTENLLNFYLKVPNWEVKCIENTTRPILNRSLQNYLKTYQKTRKTVKVRDHTHKYDLNKETVNFLRKIDYATLRDKAFVKIWANKDIIFLTRDGHVRKYPKSELATELKKPLKGSYLAVLPPTEQKRMIFHWFHGSGFHQCQKGSCKKTKAENFPWLVQKFMVIFQKPIGNMLTDGYIFWIIHKKNSIKSHERDRRSKVRDIATDIYRLE